jgi:hypothetical protein
MRNSVSSRCPPFLVGTFRCSLLKKTPRDCHPEDRLSWLTGDQCDLATMFRGYAMGQSKPETRSFLFTFAHERLKQTAADILGNSSAIIFNLNRYQSVCSL